jgi:uncharacterized OB-fold protein
MNRDDAFYWEGLARSELRVRVCDTCGRGAFPPLPGCPHCGGAHGTIVVPSGEATLYTWTICHIAFDPAFSDEVPYVVGVVDLPEGARIIARLDDVAPADLRADLPLRVHWPLVRDRGRLAFVPSAGGE